MAVPRTRLDQECETAQGTTTTPSRPRAPRSARPAANHVRSQPHQLLLLHLAASGITGWEAEYRFHPVRRWRFDIAFVDRKIAVEVDGGGWIQGRHSRGGGMHSDAEKLSAAAILGWRVLRVTPQWVRSGDAVRWIQEALRAREATS